jgi:hypothetical protein
MRLIRRISDPPVFGSRGGNRCPDIWETDAGDIVIIGDDVTDAVKKVLPADADLSTLERAVRIPKSVLASSLKRIDQS